MLTKIALLRGYQSRLIFDLWMIAISNDCIFSKTQLIVDFDQLSALLGISFGLFYQYYGFDDAFILG